MKWWKREHFLGCSVLVQYGDLLEVLERERGDETVKRALGDDESFTMASLTRRD